MGCVQCGMCTVWGVYSVECVQCGVCTVWGVYSVGSVQCGVCIYSVVCVQCGACTSTHIVADLTWTEWSDGNTVSL